MTGDYRKSVGRLPIVVDAPVCSTDSCVFDPDKNFIRTDFGHRYFFDFNHAWFFKDRRFHHFVHMIR